MKFHIELMDDEYINKPMDYAKAFIDSFCDGLNASDFETVAEHLLVYAKHKKAEEFKNSMRGVKKGE